MTSSERAIEPGTPIFGLVYGDGSTGGWTSDREKTAAMIGDCRAVGLKVVGLLIAKMRNEILVEAP